MYNTGNIASPVRNSTLLARAYSFTRFLDHTQRHSTVCRTPLDERSARRTYSYLRVKRLRDSKMPCVVIWVWWLFAALQDR